jgi:hypothetical protein
MMTLRKPLWAVSLFISMLATASAGAALPPQWNTVGQYMTLRLQSGTIEDSVVAFYLSGVGEGFLIANTALKDNGQAPLFCASDIELKGKNYRSMLDEELQDMVRRASKPGSRPFSTFNSVPIAVPLLHALQTKFPCEKK